MLIEHGRTLGSYKEKGKWKVSGRKGLVVALFVFVLCYQLTSDLAASVCGGRVHIDVSVPCNERVDEFVPADSRERTEIS